MNHLHIIKHFTTGLAVWLFFVLFTGIVLQRFIIQLQNKQIIAAAPYIIEYPLL